MESGYIKLFRKLTKWEWYQDSKTLHLFIHLLISANYKDGNWKGVEVKRGQVITGRKSLSIATGLSERSIRTSLDRLNKTGETTSKTTNRFSIITLCNYEEYQTPEKQNDQLPSQQATSKRPANDHKQEVKKEKKEKKTTYPEWLDLELWAEFKEMRAKIKAPLTKTAETRAINKLKTLVDANGSTQKDIVLQSVDMCWKDFYMPKSKSQEYDEPQGVI